MASVNPSPLLLLNRRVSDRLNDTKHPMGSSLEPQWTPTLIQRVLGATAETIIDAVASGEEVQLGKLGRFFPKALEERVIKSNLADKPELVIPKRLKLDFEPTDYAEGKVKELFSTVKSLKS